MRRIMAAVLVLGLVTTGEGAVFLSEIFLNPPGTFDDTREFIELQGTPGMKLDGYAVAFINGLQGKYKPLNTTPPWPADLEIDEFFSLDGLALGNNGLLVIARSASSSYPTLLSDTSFRRWNTIWNGGLDTPGKLNNDGSNTILLIRRRPGITQADPTHPGGLRWGKDIDHDFDLIRPVTRTFCSGGSRDGKRCECPEDCPGGTCQAGDFCIGGDNDGDYCTSSADCPGGTCASSADQTGDGSLDKGDTCAGGVNHGLPCTGAGDCPGGTCQDLLDMRGASTPGDITDDLEVVDEVSYEHTNGHEYDVDDRHADQGTCVGGSADGAFCDRNCDCPDGGVCSESAIKGLPRRRVHALDDPQGFNPDVLTRVDYRTKGPGWAPATGARGEMPNGNNWQDTATEQWIRGEAVQGTSGQGGTPWFHYDNNANTNPDAIQPYMTNVPLWLADGSGVDYSFAPESYQIMAGRVNPLAVPFIPGDTDRDGDCDADDIARVAAVFGNADWIFSNSFAAAPEGDSGDPATQTRPWDVDGTGDNGIEASDLQWVLNFQGDTTGRVRGRTYDSTTPSPAGVVLNSNAAVACTVTAAFSVSPPRSLSALKIGDLVTVVVSGQVTGGANTTAGEENGIMQFVHDLTLSTGGVLKVRSIEPLGGFQTTRSAVQTLLGTEGDGGLASINGYTTAFTRGLTAADPLYRVVLQAVGLGSTDTALAPAAAPRLAASTPRGLKVGHTAAQGDPASASYPAAATLTVTQTVRPDFNGDGHVAGDDLQRFVDCALGPAVLQTDPLCEVADFNGDGDVDQADFAVFQGCWSGPVGTPDAGCDN